MGVLLWILFVPSTGFLSIVIAATLGPLWYLLPLAIGIAFYKLHRNRPYAVFDDKRFLTAEQMDKVVNHIFAKPESD